MGKILFINGSPNENGCVSTAMDEVIGVLRDSGIETEKFIREFDVKSCCNVRSEKDKKNKKKKPRRKFTEKVTYHLMSMRTEEEFIRLAQLHTEIDPDRIMGVEMQRLWGYATELIRKNQRWDFLRSTPHYYFEENLLHAILISRSKKYPSCIKAINKFLPHIDNTEICLNMIPRIFGRKPPELEAYVSEWLKSDNIYAKGFALAVIVRYLPDRKYTKMWKDEIEAIHTDDAEINRLKEEFSKRIKKPKKAN